MGLPHVRVETREVYVSARGARLTKRAAYNAAANALIGEVCDCATAECGAQPGCRCQHETCRFHEDDGTLYDRVHPRLVRFLKFVDGRTQELSEHIGHWPDASGCDRCDASELTLRRYDSQDRRGR